MNRTHDRALRVGVAGLGFGAAVHAPALLRLPGVELAGIAGRSAERAQAVANKLGIARGCGSVEELLGLGLDAITLALPPHQVAEAMRKSLQADVAVLCEKPLGTDAAVAAELAGLATGRITAMDFIFAELETFSRLKQIIDSKMYGAVREVQVAWHTESWAYRNRTWSWKTDAAQGGGVIALLGSHVFFLAEWLLGPVSSLQADIKNPVAASFAPAGAKAAEDTVHCRMTHHNGVLLAAEFSNASRGSTLHRWTVTFEKATAVLENLSADYVSGFTLTVQGQPPVSEPRSAEDGRLAPFRQLAERFLKGVRDHQPVFPDLAAGARVQHLDAAVRASAATWKAVAL